MRTKYISQLQRMTEKDSQTERKFILHDQVIKFMTETLKMPIDLVRSKEVQDAIIQSDYSPLGISAVISGIAKKFPNSKFAAEVLGVDAENQSEGTRGLLTQEVISKFDKERIRTEEARQAWNERLIRSEAAKTARKDEEEAEAKRKEFEDQVKREKEAIVAGAKEEATFGNIAKQLGLEPIPNWPTGSIHSGPFVKLESKKFTKYSDKLYRELLSNGLIPKEFQTGLISYSLGGEVQIITQTDVFDLQAAIEKYVSGNISSNISDNVKNPSYYGGVNNPYEAIKVINAWKLEFNLGNTIKYISRAGKKDPSKLIEDLEKAKFYLDYEISALKEAKANKI